MEELFLDQDGNIYDISDVKKALHIIGADDCETLFIHSDVMFGKPVKGFRRSEYMEMLFGCISQLNVQNVIVPTYTFSFPNNEDYDVLNSKTSMGAFNEYFRKKADRYRTDDPLLSVSVPKRLELLFNHLSTHSLGHGSALDVVHQMEGVKFLFFGAEMAECFTYVHYVEKMMEVPYRFDMSFSGNIIFPDNSIEKRIQTIHTQCAGAKLPDKYDYFEQYMEEKGYLRKQRIADKYVACLSEKDAYREIKKVIEKNVNYFLTTPFDKNSLRNIYTFRSQNGRITHC